MFVECGINSGYLKDGVGRHIKLSLSAFKIMKHNSIIWLFSVKSYCITELKILVLGTE